MGAPSNRLLELAKKFSEKGWEIMIVTGMPNYPKGEIFDEYKAKFSSDDVIEGMKVKRYWLYASNKSKILPRIISMISFSITSLFSFKEIRKFKPDYLFTESPPLTLAFSGYVLSAISGSKFIMNVSDIWPLSAKELGVIGDGFIYSTIEKLEKFLYKKSYLCTGQSEEIIDHIKKTVPENKTYLFRNGVDVNRFEAVKKETDKPHKFRIIYAGLIGVAQNIPGIAENVNFSELEAEFHVYGDGAQRAELEKFLSENPGRNIFLHNGVKRDQIPGLLQEFDCALIPLVKNIYGAVPSKIYEAMAAGLPVLFSGSGEGAKIIEENKTGLVSQPGDYTKLKKDIELLKNSNELRNELSVNCRLTARNKFDRNKLINEFSEKLINLKN